MGAEAKISPTEQGATRALAEWISDPNGKIFSPKALRVATHALLDWFGVTLAGSQEKCADILIKTALAEGASGEATILGRKQRLNLTMAALVNGTASHALDYDDVNTAMRGHPSVVILPAILAAAENEGTTGAVVLDALIVGTQVACIIGTMLGETHYARGFHATGTVGVLGAAAGVSRLLNLTTEQTECALGLAATQASGLRVMFGTMAKPLHAGKAAEAGARSAYWAAAGMTASTGVLEDCAGFGPAFSDGFETQAIPAGMTKPMGIEANLFKFHASCYYTHAAIDALGALSQDQPVTLDETIHIYLRPELLDICNLPTPETGLEVKFSIRHLAAMVISGMDTGDIAIYDEGLAKNTDLISLREKIFVSGQDLPDRMMARVVITSPLGSVREKTVNAGLPADNLNVQEELLVAKFRRLATPIVGKNKAEILIKDLLAFAECDEIGKLLANAVISELPTA